MSGPPEDSYRSIIVTPDKIRSNSKATKRRVELQNATIIFVRDALLAYAKEHPDTNTIRWRTLAQAYFRHLIVGDPLGTVVIPKDIRTLVSEKVAEACNATGYTLPKQKPKPARKRKKK
ncbi:MAG TPA: hypothetical protein VK502_02325 [Candidatus Saccharimonadales bacterium]|nr:hypothetical protein [Candidatus Saccharimonadales bacterium]